MNPQENRDYERRLQELYKELNLNRSQQSVDTRPGQPPQRPLNHSQALQSVFDQVAIWFNRLPSASKVAVVAIATLVGFSVLRSVLQLVGALISLAILGGILYLVYKFFIRPQSLK